MSQALLKRDIVYITVMVSKSQWKPFWLATQRDPQNDWTATPNRVNYDIFAQAPSLYLITSASGQLAEKKTSEENKSSSNFLFCFGSAASVCNGHVSGEISITHAHIIHVPRVILCGGKVQTVRR